jgi:hypothetical protein
MLDMHTSLHYRPCQSGTTAKAVCGTAESGQIRGSCIISAVRRPLDSLRDTVEFAFTRTSCYGAETHLLWLPAMHQQCREVTSIGPIAYPAPAKQGHSAPRQIQPR